LLKLNFKLCPCISKKIFSPSEFSRYYLSLNVLKGKSSRGKKKDLDAGKRNLNN
jgi:hypothetical protein